MRLAVAGRSTAFSGLAVGCNGGWGESANGLPSTWRPRLDGNEESMDEGEVCNEGEEVGASCARS